jgi:ligand-binding sensor domain-containing protein
MSQYVRERWGTEKGLFGEVRAIAQTNDGYLWVGTERGLFRFDGFSFRLMADQGPSPVSILNVPGLTVSGPGTLLVRLPERNLLRYEDGKFENTLYSLQPRELAITAMCRGKDGDTLVTGIVQGLLRYREGRFETITPITSLPPSPIISIAQSADGKIWLGTRDAGIFFVDGGRATAVTGQLPSRKINSVLAAGSDVWVGTDAGLVRWNGTGITEEGVPPSLRRSQVLSMLVDRQSNLWIGTRSGLVRLNAGGLSVVGSLQSVPGVAVNALFEDREGELWAGGAFGIERWRDGAFATYGKAEGLPSDQNGPIYADSEGRTWVAPQEGGLYWLSRGRTAQVRIAGLGADVVYTIVGNSGDLWIGRQKGGLTHLRSREGNFEADTYTQAEGLAQNSVYSVYQSRDGAVWAGTLSGGVSQYRGGKFKTYSMKDGLVSNTIDSILESSDGTMWFATPNGLAALSNDRWRAYTLKDGMPSDDVNCIFEDSRGILWIGTAGGLAFLTPSGVATPRGALDRLRDQVFGLAEDKNGWLWISASNRVVRVNRDKILRGVLAEDDLREYTFGDGLRSVEGVHRDKSVVSDALGRIWLSMNGGLSVVDPALLTRNSVPAVVQVQTITADNRPVGLSGAVRIPVPPRRITFSYSAVSLQDPDRLRFRYQLDPEDTGWSKPSPAHEASYSLGPGKYRFRVVATNPDYGWTSTEATVGFEVMPLFWQTWWFQLAALLSVGLMLLALYRLRLQRLTTQLNVRFEERLGERTRIAQELHDTLLQGFLSVSMQLHVILDSLPENSPGRNSLGRIVERVKQVVEEGRNAVRGLRSSGSTSLDLEKAFSHVRQEFHLPDEIGFRVIVTGQPRPLRPVLRDEVYRIGREALINAFRHAQAKEIDLEIKYAVKQMRVLVRDDGCGIDPHVLESGRDGHWGLPGMRERAEKIGGRLRVWSRVSGGTEVELSIPSNVAFEPSAPNRIRQWLAGMRGKRNGIGQ